MERKIQGVNVAVIGACGFIASHLVEHLIEDRNCNVVAMDNLITGQKKFLHPKAKFIWFDITGSEEQLKKIFETEKIDYVFNYAAEPYIPVSFARPLHVFNINAFAALKVMNAAQECGVKGILQVSSSEIYGNATKLTNETDHVEARSTYGASKMAVDALVQVRWKEAKTPAIAMRQFNCLGERETHPYVITEIIEQLHKNPTIKLGNNSQRVFQYAGDAVRMATELLEKGNFGEVYNMGGQHEPIYMYDLAKKVGEIMGVEAVIEFDESRKRPWEIWFMQSDNTKLYSTIETRPQVSLEESLERTVNYFKNNGNKWDF